MKERMTLQELKKLSFLDFCDICMSIYTSQIVPKGFAQVSCTEDVVLYDDPNSKALVTMRLWSKLLSIHVVRPSGEWALSSHIERPTLYATMREAHRQLQNALVCVSAETNDSNLEPIPLSVDRVSLILHHNFENDKDKVISYLMEAFFIDRFVNDKSVNTSYLINHTGLTKYKIRKIFKELKSTSTIWYNPSMRGYHLTTLGYASLTDHNLLYKDMGLVYRWVYYQKGDMK